MKDVNRAGETNEREREKGGGDEGVRREIKPLEEFQIGRSFGKIRLIRSIEGIAIEKKTPEIDQCEGEDGCGNLRECVFDVGDHRHPSLILSLLIANESFAILHDALGIAIVSLRTKDEIRGEWKGSFAGHLCNVGALDDRVVGRRHGQPFVHGSFLDRGNAIGRQGDLQRTRSFQMRFIQEINRILFLKDHRERCQWCGEKTLDLQFLRPSRVSSCTLERHHRRVILLR